MRKSLHYFFCIGFLFLCITVHAQDTTIKYLNKNFEIVKDVNEASFVAYITKGGKEYPTRIFYGRENIAMEGVFADNKLTIRNGSFKMYYASTSRIMAEGKYDYNIKNGVWKQWYENGKMKDSGRLYYGKMVGRWSFWHENGQLLSRSKYADSFATPENITKGVEKMNKPFAIADYLERFYVDVKSGLWKVFYDNGQQKDSINYVVGEKNGLVKLWFANGNLEAVGNFINDKEDGEWKWYHFNGQPATIEKYKNGKIFSMQCFDSLGKFVGDFCSINKPAIFPGGSSKFEDYIKKNVIYPNDAKPFKHSAVVSCTFTINTQGKVSLVTFGESPIIYFNREIENALYKMPAWDPAIFHNRLVDFDVKLSVPFEYTNLPLNTLKN